MQKVVSLAVRFPYNGKQYSGVSIKNGVPITFSPARCGVARTEILFENASSNPIIFLEGVTGADIDSSQVPDNYLVVHPKVNNDRREA